MGDLDWQWLINAGAVALVVYVGFFVSVAALALAFILATWRRMREQEREFRARRQRWERRR